MKYFLTVVLLCTSSVIAGRRSLPAKLQENTETGRGVLGTLLGSANKLCFCQCGIANTDRYDRALADSSTVAEKESESNAKVKVRQSINTPKDATTIDNDEVVLDLNKRVKVSTEEKDVPKISTERQKKSDKAAEKEHTEKEKDEEVGVKKEEAKPKDGNEATTVKITSINNDRKDLEETTTEKSDKIIADKKEDVKDKAEKIAVAEDGDKIKLSDDAESKLSDAENNDATQGKLIGGDVPQPHEFPWVVLILVKSKLVAGGALITDRHILTAASPLILAVPVDVKVTLGVHDRCENDATSVNISVEAITRHPGFSTVERAHDLALLTLATSPRFDRRISPICLPQSQTSYKNQVTTVVSWLSTTDAATAPPSCLPRRVRQPVLPKSECAQSVSSQALLTPDKSCIGVFGSTAVLCRGDVGSPVQYPIGGDRYELLGILTDVNTCNTKNSTLFVRVADHLNWISQATSKDCYCTRF